MTPEQSNQSHESEQTVSHTADLTAENTNPETQTEQIDDNVEEDKQVIIIIYLTKNIYIRTYPLYTLDTILLFIFLLQQLLYLYHFIYLCINIYYFNYTRTSYNYKNEKS